MTTISRPEQIFDVRLAERHINSGRITKKDVEQYVRNLPDAADNVEVIQRDVIFEGLIPEE